MRIQDWRSGLVVFLLAVGVALAAAANDEEEEACKEACRVAHGECADFCADHDDPIQCDADCREREFDCRQRCE